jgi:hypothetical protein
LKNYIMEGMCTDPFMHQEVNEIVRVLEDDNGQAIRVISSKLLPDAVLTDEIKLRLSVGKLEPLVELRDDGCPAIRIMESFDVVSVKDVQVDDY